LEVHGLQCAPATLAKKACNGTGPEICFVNKIPFHKPAALDAYAKASIGKPTTQAQKDAYDRNRSRLRRGDPSPARTANTETSDLQPLPP
jgi:hypothetical protein